METPMIIDEDDIRQYTCDFCNKYDETEVGEASGFNGETASVCNNCDMDGCDYNGWGGYDEHMLCNEASMCDCCEQCKDCLLCKCDAFENSQRLRKCYDCDEEYYEEYMNYIYNIITTKCNECSH